MPEGLVALGSASFELSGAPPCWARLPGLRQGDAAHTQSQVVPDRNVLTSDASWWTFKVTRLIRRRTTLCVVDKDVSAAKSTDGPQQIS